ncbi:MAG: cytochrome c biogenesis protein CcsA [Deltaproteobacteria bacterium]|nr:MAG: cytochrome c biogenesis protein CcsA [Deltaproteobacteria bacterium]
MAYILCFFISFFFYFILFLLSLPGEKRSRLFFKIGLVPPVFFNGIAFLTMTVQSGHLPSHFLFERFVQLGFGLGFFLWIISLFEDTRRVTRYVLLMILILFGISLVFPFELKPPVYRYSILMSQLFFQLEALGFVLMAFSSAYCLLYLVEKKRPENRKPFLTKGRNYLLIGFVFFLASQFFGSIWSLQGWGDYWMWGKMSFMGVVLWFYVMFVIHSRYVTACRETFEAGVGSLLFLMIIIYRMVWQP